MQTTTVTFQFDVDDTSIHPDAVAARIYELLREMTGVQNPQRVDHQ
jgi:hypothetical protein